jgi:hypothetical protein
MALLMHRPEHNFASSFVIFAIVVMLVFAISGCSTVVPVTVPFPPPPGSLVTVACPDLKKIDRPVLSEIATTVTVNYGTYYECAVKVDVWNQWYQEQKAIFEQAGK